MVTGPRMLMGTSQVKQPPTFIYRPTYRGEGYGAKCHLIIPPSVMWKGERKPYILGDRETCQPHLSTDLNRLACISVLSLIGGQWSMSGVLSHILWSLVSEKSIKQKRLLEHEAPTAGKPGEWALSPRTPRYREDRGPMHNFQKYKIKLKTWSIYYYEKQCKSIVFANRSESSLHSYLVGTPRDDPCAMHVTTTYV